MAKTLTLAFALLVLVAGGIRCQAQDPLKVGSMYRVVFAVNGGGDITQNMDSSSLYVIRIVAISDSHPNWILIEFPREANRAHNSEQRGQRWINLDYIVALKAVSAGA